MTFEKETNEPYIYSRFFPEHISVHGVGREFQEEKMKVREAGEAEGCGAELKGADITKKGDLWKLYESP